MSTHSGRDEILVGIDPVGSHTLPVDWAADQARRRELRLHAVLAVPPRHDTQHVDSEPQHMHHVAVGEKVLAQVVEQAETAQPGIVVRTELVEGPAARALAVRCHRARFTVLGSRGLGRVAAYFSAGSVILPLAAHADSTVVVVHTPPHSTQRPPYVVAALGDAAASVPVLDEAYELADSSRGGLRVMWCDPHSDAFGEGGASVPAASAALSEALAGRRQEYPDVRMEREAARVGTAAVDAACEHALAVVVGRRGGPGVGHGLGPLARHLLRDAHCPVVVEPTAA